MDWTTPNESRMKAEFAGYAGGAYPQKTKISVAGQFAAVK